MSRDLKILSAAMLTWGLGEGMFLIFLPLYIQQFGADPTLIGTVLGVNGLSMAVSQIPAGFLADKIGRRPVMWFSWVMGVIATSVMALAPSLTVFVIGLILYGVTSSVVAPLNTYVQGARGGWSVGKAVTFISAAYNTGGILGPVIGGFIGDAFSMRSVYFGAAGLFFISTSIVFFISEQPISERLSNLGSTRLWRNQRFMKMLIIIFLIMFAVTLPQPMAANFLQNQRGFSLSRIGQLGSIGALGSVILMLAFGHQPAGIAFLIGQVGLMLFSFLLWQGEGLLWVGLGYFALGGYRLCRAMTVALVRPVVREQEVGLAFGFVESLNAFAFVVAPILAGFVYDWRPIAIFPISLGVIALTILLTIRYVRRNGHDPDDVAEEPMNLLRGK
jgi:MFS family permease